jgi:glycine/D-amino acid oxidase-like deaminating enzyme
MPDRTADAVVIGGGIRGACIAYYLAKAKVKVALIEKNDLVFGATSRNGALIRMGPKEPAVYTQLGLESGKLYLELVQDLEGPVELRRKGALNVILTEKELGRAKEFVAQQQMVPGNVVKLLDRRETLELEPALSESITGSIYYPNDMDINPMFLTLEVVKAAQRYRAQVFTHTKAIGIDTSDSKVTGVKTTQGSFSTPVVVNAAGVDVPEVGRMVGLMIPVFRIRGQVITTERIPPLISRFVGEIYQTVTGNLSLGVTNQFMGHETRSTFPEVAPVLQQAAHVLPAIKEVSVIRIWTGIRPVPPDGLPILGGVVGLGGYYTATGHGGITTGPITGKLAADLITTGKTDIPLYPFLLARFGRMQLQLNRKMFEDYWKAGERYHSETKEETAKKCQPA